MGRSKVYVIFDWSTWGCIRSLWIQEECIDKRMQSCNLWGNILENVIINIGGSFELSELIGSI